MKRDEDWLKSDGKYIPHPATWLRAHGWLDEYPKVAAKSNPAKPRILVDSGPQLNDYVMKANRVLFSYLRHHRGVPEEALQNMIRNKNQFAALMEEERPPEGSHPDVYRKLADESRNHLARLYRSWDAILERHRGEINE